MNFGDTARDPRRNRAILAIVVLLLAGAAWWLTRPASDAAIGISAQTGSLTVEPLCGERLIWDLPVGRIGPRSAPPGTEAIQTGNVTLVLGAGARAHLESTGPGVLRLSVDRAENFAQECAVGSAPSFQAIVDGSPLPDDPGGFRYAANAPGVGESSNPLSLLLSGHIVLGQAVQQGGGWAPSGSAILESGTVALRVVPSLSDERVTLRTETLDAGSLIDTHACLTPVEGSSITCPARNAAPAQGFLRTVPSGGLRVQMYARGPVGVQPFSGADQHVLSVPNSIAAWRSEWLQVGAMLFVLLFGFWKYLVEGVDSVINLLNDRSSTPKAAEPPTSDKTVGAKQDDDGAHSLKEVTGHMLDEQRKEKIRRQSPVAAFALFVVLGSITTGLAPRMVHAEAVEIRQGDLEGAGYSFRRGASCLVVTAHHVVKESGAVTVLDRTGAKVVGSRTYANASYDLALIELPDNSSVACTTTWPDVAWLRSAAFTPKSELRAIRHYSSGGREEQIRLTPAGGASHHLFLAPIDKRKIIESDSGTIVELDGRLVGIVLSVDTDRDRITVLRFDTIDDLVGDRFRGGAGKRVINFAGVSWRGRENPSWSTYVQSWIAEKTGLTVVQASRAAGAAPAATCEVKVEVLSWDRVAVSNPEFDGVQLQLKVCGKRGFFYEQLCSQAKAASAHTPRQVMSQKIVLNAIVTPSGAAPLSKLVTNTYMPQSSKVSRTEIEVAALQAAVGPTLTELFNLGSCQ